MNTIIHDAQSRLPAAVFDLALRLGVDPARGPRDVQLTQTGRMKSNLASPKWMTFTAKQWLAADRCAFDWRARAGPLGLITGRDALLEGVGRFDILALGFIPIARAAHTSALVRGELMRYLAEIAWVPHAILHNRALRWRVIDAETLAVATGSGVTACEVILSLNTDGRVAGAYAPDRPRRAIRPVLPTPWRGRFLDYRRHEGLWLPFAAEVEWRIDGKSIPYWQCRMGTWRG